MKKEIKLKKKELDVLISILYSIGTYDEEEQDVIRLTLDQLEN